MFSCFQAVDILLCLCLRHRMHDTPASSALLPTIASQHATYSDDDELQQPAHTVLVVKDAHTHVNKQERAIRTHEHAQEHDSEQDAAASRVDAIHARLRRMSGNPLQRAKAKRRETRETREKRVPPARAVASPHVVSSPQHVKSDAHLHFGIDLEMMSMSGDEQPRSTSSAIPITSTSTASAIPTSSFAALRPISGAGPVHFDTKYASYQGFAPASAADTTQTHAQTHQQMTSPSVDVTTITPDSTSRSAPSPARGPSLLLGKTRM